MTSENEPAKLLLPYLQRADELQKHEPLVAYYCRLYAMEKGLKIPQNERTKTTNNLLISLMNQLEKDKKSLKLGPEDNLHIEGFSLNVFAKADKQDRAGRADLNAAKTFYAASIFFEILNQFGPLQPDLEQKQKYAVWKAADIRKALKEGRRPNPGPPSEDDDLSVPSNGYDLGPGVSATPSSQSEPDPSPHFHNQVDSQHSTTIPPSPPPQFYENLSNQHSTHIPMQPQLHDSMNNQHLLTNIPPPLQPYQPSTYPSHEYIPPAESSKYHPQYQHQSSSQEPQQYPMHSYASTEASTYSYPNFQSYPSFTESSLPSVPSHYPSYPQGSDSSYPPQPPSAPATSYPSSAQYASANRTNSDPTPSSTQTYKYDPNYQPPPEKITEAHKAARFAVGALAFDDVSVAVDFLKKSLELLTNPSAGN